MDALTLTEGEKWELGGFALTPASSTASSPESFHLLPGYGRGNLTAKSGQTGKPGRAGRKEK